MRPPTVGDCVSFLVPSGLSCHVEHGTVEAVKPYSHMEIMDAEGRVHRVLFQNVVGKHIKKRSKRVLGVS